MGRPVGLDLSRFDAVLFDLDGVLTQTADLHAAAWKLLFDEFLQARNVGRPIPHVPFDIDHDYPIYVDGKPRHEGVRSFLDARGIKLPLGSPSDTPDRKTVYGLGNGKDTYFEGQLRKKGVVVYPNSVRFLSLAKARGLKTGVVSSSHHTQEVLEAAGLTPFFETRMDGYEIDRLHLKGKPAPDSFWEASRRLNVLPQKTMVIEDALSGVQAGRAGGFGLVIGINRRDQAEELSRHGADIVVADLGELLPDDKNMEARDL